MIKEDGDWWTGKIGDRVGVFPFNYVQPIDGEVRETVSPFDKTKLERFYCLCLIFCPNKQKELTLSESFFEHVRWFNDQVKQNSFNQRHQHILRVSVI